MEKTRGLFFQVTVDVCNYDQVAPMHQYGNRYNYMDYVNSENIMQVQFYLVLDTIYCYTFSNISSKSNSC